MNGPLRAALGLGLSLLLGGCGLAAVPGLPAVPPLVTPLPSAAPSPTAAPRTAATQRPSASPSAAPSATVTRPPTLTAIPATTEPTLTPSATVPPCAPAASQIISISVPSTTYPRPVPATVYLPPCYNQASAPLPVIYLLHGGNSDQTQWPDLDVQPAADALIAGGAAPFLVVMPGGIYGTYGVDYDDFVLADLIPGTEDIFNASRQSRARAIGGVSQGGYFALKVAFDHPDQFAAVEGNSPVISHGAAEDPLARAHTAEGLNQLRIWLDVGDQDSLHDGTLLLAQVLRARGLPVELSVSPGSHIRSYWRAHIADYLRFYLAALEPAGT